MGRKVINVFSKDMNTKGYEYGMKYKNLMGHFC